MKIGVLKEVKTREGRVCLIPSNIKDLVGDGHQVFVQKDAGVISGFSNDDYVNAGAEIIDTTKDLIDAVDLVVKVKEPTIEEVKMMREGQMFFGYLHLAAIPETLQAILDQKITALGFETLQLSDGRLPLLAPMSEIAGKLATQNGAHFLRFDQGGRGVLLGGTSTVEPAKVVILGAGVVGKNAADIAVGMGAKTTILDVSKVRLSELEQIYKGRCDLKLSTPELIEELVQDADLVVGGVLIVGEKAPKLVNEALVKKMKKGSVIVDVSVDQGGCVETSEVTTHENPVIEKHGVLHYGVANMPGSVPVTATMALNHESFPYIRVLAKHGLASACEVCPEFKSAINCQGGVIKHHALEGVV
ncbi:MAG: alanine dehydrogenase [Deltaproteobacteria bacterium]|nr:alanine dehydrogenase [Deltaproteobacteria bacterium]